MSSDDERQWVARAARDPTAFTRLYEAYFPRLYAYARYRVRTDGEAEDVVADTFLRVVERLPGFRWRHEGSFAAWIFRIAHNLLVDRMRGPRPALPLEEAGEVRDRLLLPDAFAVQQENFEELHALVGTLSPRRQEVITLRFFAGLRNREIAAVLQLDERTVAAHLCRALEDLHQRYEAHSQTKGPTHECAG